MKAFATLGRLRPVTRGICALPRLSVSRVAAARIPIMRAFSTASTPSEAPAAISAEAGTMSESPRRKYTHVAVSEPSIKTGGEYVLPHPIWKKEYLEAVERTHRTPTCTEDKLALWTIKAIRFNFDWMSGYVFRRKSEKLWLDRMIFLESVAAVPGSIGAILRHLSSLRNLKRDYGWIHTLLEEAENERMHLLTAMELRKPGPAFRLAILLTQGVFFNFFWISYLIKPSFCHRVVGYLEEEAVITYTHMLKSIDDKEVWVGTPAPEVAKKYWRLKDDATMRDVIANIRADESHHRDVNHQFASLKPDEPNPFLPGH